MLRHTESRAGAEIISVLHGYGFGLAHFSTGLILVRTECCAAAARWAPALGEALCSLGDLVECGGRIGMFQSQSFSWYLVLVKSMGTFNCFLKGSYGGFCCCFSFCFLNQHPLMLQTGSVLRLSANGSDTNTFWLPLSAWPGQLRANAPGRILSWASSAGELITFGRVIE